MKRSSFKLGGQAVLREQNKLFWELEDKFQCWYFGLADFFKVLTDRKTSCTVFSMCSTQYKIKA